MEPSMEGRARETVAMLSKRSLLEAMNSRGVFPEAINRTMLTTACKAIKESLFLLPKVSYSSNRSNSNQFSRSPLAPVPQ